jgi:hypothetical protein
MMVSGELFGEHAGVHLLDLVEPGDTPIMNGHDPNGAGDGRAD